MKISGSRLFLPALLIWMVSFQLSGQKVLNDHFEWVEQFSKTQSKSKSLASYAKRNITEKKVLDSTEWKYMDLKEASDGAISRYKSIIDNPNVAKKNEITITEEMNEMISQLNDFTKFVSTKSQGFGFNPIGGLALLGSIAGLGANVFTEIKNMQKGKRDQLKAEIDQYKLIDWVEIK